MVEVMDLWQSQISNEIGCLLASADDLGDVANALLRQERGKRAGDQAEQPAETEPRAGKYMRFQPDRDGPGPACAPQSQTPKTDPEFACLPDPRTNISIIQDHDEGAQAVHSPTLTTAMDQTHTDILVENRQTTDEQTEQAGEMWIMWIYLLLNQ